MNRKQRIGSYTVEEICPGVYAMDTDAEESMYLVCGTEKAVLIDTGSDPSPVLPVIRKLYSGPVELLLTHAHYDHMYHSDEFGSVSLHRDDAAAWKRVLGPIVFLSTAGSGKKPKRYPVSSWHLLREGDVIPLGGKALRVVDACGHTPGSVLFADDADRLIFMGDAIGSGSFAWMWMPGCTCLSRYLDSLKHIEQELDAHPDYRLLGGHRIQGVVSAAYPDANPLTAGIAHDMETLCVKIRSGELKPYRSDRYFGFKTYTYRWGTAAIVLRPAKIR